MSLKICLVNRLLSFYCFFSFSFLARADNKPCTGNAPTDGNVVVSTLIKQSEIKLYVCKVFLQINSYETFSFCS